MTQDVKAVPKNSMRAAMWWIDRWRQSDSFARMTAEEQGLYRNLCDEIVLRDDGLIPDDERMLAKASGDHVAWARSGKSVLKSMRKVAGGWTNDTALEVKNESERRTKSQSDKGKESAAGAVRKGGKFASRKPTNSPTETPTGRPAENQPPEQEQDKELGTGNGERETTALDGKPLDAIECPGCGKVGSLKHSQSRNGNPPGFWCDRRLGCGVNWPLNTEAILSLMTSRGRSAIEAMLPEEQKPYVSPGMIISSVLKFDEKGMLVE